jgi:hypothetical protein
MQLLFDVAGVAVGATISLCVLSLILHAYIPV